jgi:hypothetical protein
MARRRRRAGGNDARHLRRRLGDRRFHSRGISKWIVAGPGGSGSPSVLTRLDSARGELSDGGPRFLPDPGRLDPGLQARGTWRSKSAASRKPSLSGEKNDAADSSPMCYSGRGLLRPPPGEIVGHARVVRVHPFDCRSARAGTPPAYFITDHVRRNALGVVFGQDTGFRIESSPDTVRDRTSPSFGRHAFQKFRGTAMPRWCQTSSRKSSRPRTDPANISRRSRSGSRRARRSCGSSTRNVPRPTFIARTEA